MRCASAQAALPQRYLLWSRAVDVLDEVELLDRHGVRAVGQAEQDVRQHSVT